MKYFRRTPSHDRNACVTEQKTTKRKSNATNTRASNATDYTAKAKNSTPTNQIAEGTQRGNMQNAPAELQWKKTKSKERAKRTTTTIAWTQPPHRHQERTTMTDKHRLHIETKHRQENKKRPIANKQNPTEHQDMMTRSRKW